MLGTTYGGNHLACAASLAVLEVLESENLMQHAQEMGAYLIERLSTNVAIQEIRGKGLMIGLEFSEPVADMRKKMCYDRPHLIQTPPLRPPSTYATRLCHLVGTRGV